MLLLLLVGGAWCIAGSRSRNKAAAEVLDTLTAMQSVTTAGLNYAEYSHRALDMKVVVDRYLAVHRSDDKALASAVERVMDLHLFAVQVWNADILSTTNSYEGPNFVDRNHQRVSELCPPVVRVWDKAKEGNRQFAGGKYTTFSPEHYRAALEQSLVVLWQCAFDTLADAKRTLEKRC